MSQFSTAREAKEFLVSRIVEEAHSEGVPLSEVERKMLYFTESGWTLPDMIEVSNEFDSDYDQSDYEKKIASLITNVMKRDRKENPQYVDSWMNAVCKFRKEDHYILVMIGQAGTSARPPGDTFTLLCTALAIVTFLLVGTWISFEYEIDFGKYLPSKETTSFMIWAAVASVAIAYILTSFVLGKKKMNDLFAKSMDKLFKRPDLDK